MSKLTVRGRLLVRNLCFWLCIVALLCTLFLPIIRLEWSEGSYGVTEKYYANVSLIQLCTGAEVQVKLENANEWKELGFTQEQINETLGMTTVNFENGKSLLLILGGVTLLMLLTSYIASGTKGAKRSMEKQYEKMGLNAKESIAVTIIFGSFWKNIVLFTFAFPCFAGWCALLFFNFLDKPIEHLTTTAVIVPLVIVFVLLILSSIFSKSSKKWFDDMLAQKVFTKERLKTLPFSGDVSTIPVMQETATVCTSNDPVPNNATASDPALLLKYKELLDAGAITQEEYDQKKKEILK